MRPATVSSLPTPFESFIVGVLHQYRTRRGDGDGDGDGIRTNGALLLRRSLRYRAWPFTPPFKCARRPPSAAVLSNVDVHHHLWLVDRDVASPCFAMQYRTVPAGGRGRAGGYPWARGHAA